MTPVDDPRLTAYALGEEPEAKEMEGAVASDPALRAAAGETRAMADRLTEALRGETAPSLGVDRRLEVLRASREARERPRLRRAVVGLSWAASVVLAAGLGMSREEAGRGGDVGATTADWGDVQRNRFGARPAPRSVGTSNDSGVFYNDGSESEEDARRQAERFDGAGAGTYGEVAGRVPSPKKFRGPGGSVPPGVPPPAVRSAPTALGDASTGVGAPGRGANAPKDDVFFEDRPVFAFGTGEDGEGRRLLEEHRTDAFDAIVENDFQRVVADPLSTFSIDVDTASYSIVRRHLAREGRLPPAGAVRIEELVNSFSYDYAPPAGDEPFAVHLEAAECPWNPKHRLVRVGLKGKVLSTEARPTANLVFLVDVSGSMASEDKLPLVQKGLRLLVETLRPDDRVAMVVYAGASGLVLPSTPGSRKDEILAAVDRLSAGGSTNGASGLQQAYEQAAAGFVKGGVNRVILATDGDWNVGVTDQSSLVSMIEEKAKTGVFLTVLGFGMGNLKDSTLEKLADKGNGNYGYVDSLQEARRLLVEQANGTLVTIAKDVKIQVEWNPARVEAYRLVGYENRRLAAQDFTDDRKDAGEIGAGHSVTAFYEVVPAGTDVGAGTVEPLKYQPPRSASGTASADTCTVKLRWKRPDEDVSRPTEVALVDEGRRYGESSRDFRFASSVASFGMLLRGSAYKGLTTWDAVLETAQEAVGPDLDGRRAELVDLVRKAKALSEAKR